MVAALEQPELTGHGLRLLEILSDSGLPGARSDHEWMAQRIWSYAKNLETPDACEYLADLLTTGFLLEHGIDPSTLTQLQGRDFPDAALRAVPPLLKIGCPASSWRLVEKGVLCYEGTVWGGEGRWVIRGQILKPLTDEWHELGEQMVLQHVARGLVPLVHDFHTPPQIKLSGVDRKTGRKWLAGLRDCLAHLGGSRLPHLMIEN